MGQTLLTNQFVAGLRSELKRKLIGVDGGLEELILKAKCEEGKSVELTSAKTPMRETPVSKSPLGVGVTAAPTAGSVTTCSVGTRSSQGKCFTCGSGRSPAPTPRKGNEMKRHMVSEEELLCWLWREATIAFKNEWRNSNKNSRMPASSWQFVGSLR